MNKRTKRSLNEPSWIATNRWLRALHNISLDCEYSSVVDTIVMSTLTLKNTLVEKLVLFLTLFCFFILTVTSQPVAITESRCIFWPKFCATSFHCVLCPSLPSQLLYTSWQVHYNRAAMLYCRSVAEFKRSLNQRRLIQTACFCFPIILHSNSKSLVRTQTTLKKIYTKAIPY